MTTIDAVASMIMQFCEKVTALPKNNPNRKELMLACFDVQVNRLTFDAQGNIVLPKEVPHGTTDKRTN